MYILSIDFFAKIVGFKAGIGGSSSSGAQSDALPKEVKNGKPSNDSVEPPLASEDSISEFIAQVASLVK